MSESVKKPTRAEEIEAVSKELAKRNLALAESTRRLAEFNSKFRDKSWCPSADTEFRVETVKISRPPRPHRNGLRLVK